MRYINDLMSSRLNLAKFMPLTEFNDRKSTIQWLNLVFKSAEKLVSDERVQEYKNVVKYCIHINVFNVNQNNNNNGKAMITKNLTIS